MVRSGNETVMQQVSMRYFELFNFVVRAKTTLLHPLITLKSGSNSSLTYHPFVLDVTVAVTFLAIQN